jgi:hypothetical protein
MSIPVAGAPGSLAGPHFPSPFPGGYDSSRANDENEQRGDDG